MSIVETNPDAVIGGVDTHADVHVAAAINHVGGVLGVEAFATTRTGYRQLVSWLRSYGELTLVGVEGTGSYPCRRHHRRSRSTQPPNPASKGQVRSG